MEKDTSIQVIYIAGNGHSGSTLLDMILGASEGCFSAGELTFITRDTILEEYCSCNNKISECEIWSQIFDLWETEREISYITYKQLCWRFQRNKSTFRTIKNKLYPSKAFKQYCKATLQLYQVIKQVTNCSVIVDSSKSPQRIAALSEIVDLQVLHICRDFTGVLNSGKSSARKNIEAGIEEDLPARRTWIVVRDWIFTNIVTELFCLGVDSQKVSYKSFVNNPETLRKIHPALKQLTREQAYSADHMLAGNVIRLKKNLRIDPEVGFLFKRLNSRLYNLGKVMDKLFWFWT